MIFGNSYNAKRAYLFLFFLLLPTVIFLNNELIWDDEYVFSIHSHWSINTLLGPYAINSFSYWRPLTVLTIALPNLLGIPIWANKLISVILFFIVGSLSIAILDTYLKSRKLAINSVPLVPRHTSNVGLSRSAGTGVQSANHSDTEVSRGFATPQSGFGASEKRHLRHDAALVILAILFAVHPVFVETTLWIAARADLLVSVFVLLSVYWILQFRNHECNAQNPESTWKGFLRGFALTWAVCAAKDSGLVWAGIALFAILRFSTTSLPAWKAYWWHWVGGILIALYSYLSARSDVLGQVTGLSGIAQHNAPSIIDRLRLFLEFVIRSLLNIFLPFFDQAPFKSSGWLANISPTLLIVMLLLVVSAIGVLFFKLYWKNKSSFWLLICAVIPLVFLALLETFSAPNFGTIISARLLAPSAALIYISLAMLFLKPASPEATEIKINDIKQFNISVIIIFTIVLLQSFILWTESRIGWSTNLGLWESSWDHGSQSRTVAENYSTAHFVKGNFVVSRNIARYWIAKHPEPESHLKLCKLYQNVLSNDVALKDENDAHHYAKRAVDIGWCNAALAQNISFFLMKDECKLVLPMINQAIAEGQKPYGIGMWQFENLFQIEQLTLIAAYGEARCGSESKAIQRLNEAAHINKEWVASGEKAQGLIHLARSD